MLMLPNSEIMQHHGVFISCVGDCGYGHGKRLKIASPLSVYFKNEIWLCVLLKISGLEFETETGNVFESRATLRLGFDRRDKKKKNYMT